MGKNILIIAGEPSGDIRAGELLKELKKLIPDAVFWGIGGDSSRNEGVELVEHIRNLSIVGIWEAVKNAAKIIGQYRNITRHITERKPDLAILIDYPGFNLRVANFLRKKKIPVVYYIIPQIWAWGAWRVKSIKKAVDKALVLFKFEEDLLLKHGIDAEFVGHPLVDAAEGYKLSAIHDNFTIALLPGSRKSEIEMILPALLDSAEILYKHNGNIRFTMAENSNISRDLYNSFLEKHKNLPIDRFANNTFLCLSACDFAVVASGTATLETAIMEKPMVIVYKASAITAFLARAIMTVPFFGLVNIIAKEEIAPEILQENLTPGNLSEEILKIIDDPERMEHMKRKLKDVENTLGEKGASKRAALAVKNFMVSNNLYNKTS